MYMSEDKDTVELTRWKMSVKMSRLMLAVRRSFLTADKNSSKVVLGVNSKRLSWNVVSYMKEVDDRIMI
jgi:hypothetical protein